MSDWGVATFLWDHNLAGLTASSEDSAHPASNMLLLREGNWYKAASATTPIYVYPPSGPGNGTSLTSDFLYVHGYNLFTIGATITLQRSATGAWAGEEVDVATKTPTDNFGFAALFSSVAADYWRLKITGSLSAPPVIAIGYWGERTELGHMTASFDPYQRRKKEIVNRTSAHVIAGQHHKHYERRLKLRWDDADDDFYQKLAGWQNGCGTELFGVLWEPDLHPSDVFLMSSDGNFNDPLTIGSGGAYRNTSATLTGRMEE